MAVDEWLPHAEIVYDKFHLLNSLGKAIDEVRKEEHRAAPSEMKHVIKGQRFNLLRHTENLLPSGEIALLGLLEINEKINTAYLLKDQFRFVWNYRRGGWARRYLRQWISWSDPHLARNRSPDEVLTNYFQRETITLN